MNTIDKSVVFTWSWWSLLVFGVVLLLAGCDEGTVSTPTTTEDDHSESDETNLPSDIRLKITYDQTEIVYTNVWPNSIVGNENQAKKARAKRTGAKLMTEYEKTHEIRSYSDDGYLTAQYEYKDGNHPDMNMPSKAYNDLKSSMPLYSEGKNPVTRSKLVGNTIKYFRKDGSLARSHPIDPEEFRIDPAQLDSLEELQRDSSTSDQRRSEMLASLRRRDISFRRLGENRVSYQRNVNDVRGTANVKKVVDLRLGRAIYLKYKLKNGNTSMVETRRYKDLSGFPIMVESVTYNYDDRSGKWRVVTRTERKRTNISVIFN